MEFEILADDDAMCWDNFGMFVKSLIAWLLMNQGRPVIFLKVIDYSASIFLLLVDDMLDSLTEKSQESIGRM